MLGLDVPAPVQYVRWLGGIFLRGTLGDSLFGGATVEERIIGRLPITVELGVLSILIGLVIAVPVGIYSAVRQDTAGDYTGRSIAIIGLATPNFWLATHSTRSAQFGYGAINGLRTCPSEAGLISHRVIPLRLPDQFPLHALENAHFYTYSLAIRRTMSWSVLFVPAVRWRSSALRSLFRNAVILVNAVASETPKCTANAHACRSSSTLPIL